jgi:hypothetical protein
MAGPNPAGPGRIFISYRREETAYPAGWLYDRLAERFGPGQVFKDVDSIQLGDDFVQVITGAVGSCDVVLALIGSHWLSATDQHGRRRLDDPDDFVRLEIEAALSRGVRVIPILVDGARMPTAEQLPDSLAKLVRRQALELSPARFDSDLGRLLKVLEATLAATRTGPDTGRDEVRARPEQQRPRSRRIWVLAGAGVAAALVLAVAAVLANSRTTPPSEGGGSGVQGLAVVPQTDCTREWFAQDPPVASARVRSVELEAVDRRVLGTGEPQDQEFGLVFSDVLQSTEPQVLGAMKVVWRPGTGFQVIGVVDEQTCKPVGVSEAADPGVPARPALGDYEWLLMVLAGRQYLLLLNSSNSNTEVLVTLNRKA